jgi:hypothetical protein
MKKHFTFQGKVFIQTLTNYPRINPVGNVYRETKRRGFGPALPNCGTVPALAATDRFAPAYIVFST